MNLHNQKMLDKNTWFKSFSIRQHQLLHILSFLETKLYILLDTHGKSQVVVFTSFHPFEVILTNIFVTKIINKKLSLFDQCVYLRK